MGRILFIKAALEYTVGDEPVTVVIQRQVKDFKVTVYEAEDAISTLDADLYRVLYPIIQQLRGY